MDLEETKKIIRNKIEAYIHEKQNLREGFTETFKPSIESQEAVKTIIDTQQNKLIKQLQDNQLALTEGLNKNRLAITSGFDKMDEVRKWDLVQLPGYEAIEYPEIETVEPEGNEEERYYISYNDIYRVRGQDHRIKESDEKVYGNKKSLLDEILSQKKIR